MQDTRKITAGGAPEGFDAQLVLAELRRSGRAVLHIARDDKRLVAMRAALGFFAPEVPVLDFPAWDCVPYDRVSPNPDVSAARMATLAALARGMPDGIVVLTTLNAATQKVPTREVLRGSGFTAQVGQRMDEAALRIYLARMGFAQCPTVTEPGDFAVRGGIIDIYPPGEGGPVRLDLFGDGRDGLTRQRNAPPKNLMWSNWPRSAKLSWTRPRSPGSAKITGSNLARQAPTTRFTRRSAPGASTRGPNIGCRTSTTTSRLYLITFPKR